MNLRKLIFLLFILAFIGVLPQKRIVDTDAYELDSIGIELNRYYALIDNKSYLSPSLWMNIRFDYDHKFYTAIGMDSTSGIWDIKGDTLLLFEDWKEYPVFSDDSIFPEKVGNDSR